MPGKTARSTLDQAFGLPEVLVAVSTSRPSCKRAGKTRTLMPVWDSSGESRLKSLANISRGCPSAAIDRCGEGLARGLAVGLAPARAGCRFAGGITAPRRPAVYNPKGEYGNDWASSAHSRVPAPQIRTGATRRSAHRDILALARRRRRRSHHLRAGRDEYIPRLSVPLDRNSVWDALAGRALGMGTAAKKKPRSARSSCHTLTSCTPLGSRNRD